MSCISRSPDHPLTSSQKGELLRLFAIRAIDRPSAAHAYASGMEGCNANVLGALMDKGLSVTCRKTAGGRQIAHYYLTRAGVLRVAEITGQGWEGPKGKAGCGRDPAAGPGSCAHWWEGCPRAEARGCYQLWAKRLIGRPAEPPAAAQA